MHIATTQSYVFPHLRFDFSVRCHNHFAWHDLFLFTNNF